MTTWIKACTASELRERRMITIKPANRSIVLFAEEDRLYAIDNRCTHDNGPVGVETTDCIWVAV